MRATLTLLLALVLVTSLVRQLTDGWELAGRVLR
jgi:hypothetical protein